MYRSILVPLDGSSHAEHALTIATDIARTTYCDLHLVHVFHEFVVDELPFYGFSGEAARAGAENFVLSKALRLQRTLESKVDGALLEGPTTTRAIVERAERVRADLIVMGSHGRTGASRFWLGSVADSVIRSSPIPVLMARDQAMGNRAPSRFERLLVPLDGSDLAEAALPHAMAFAEMHGAHVHFLRIEEHAKDLRMSVWGLAASEPDDVQLRLERADRYLDSVAADCALTSVSKEAKAAHRIGEAIAQVAIDRDADLIAMATHGRGASRMLIGSVADKVIRGTDCSMLLLRAR